MTKHCRAPHCFNSAGQPRPDGQRLSFYKFPLHNPKRLRQWLSQMKQEKWIPTKHQHLCSEHFAPSCFEYRWGMRYLKPDAVPTIFQTSSGPLKRENSARPPCDVPSKKFILKSQGEESMPGLQNSSRQEPHALETTLAFAIDPGMGSTPVYVETQPSASDLGFSPLVGAVNLVPLVQIVEPLKAVTLAVASPAGAVPGQPLPEAVEQHVVDLVASLPPAQSTVGVSGPFCAKMVAATDQALVVNESEQGALIIENVSIEPFLEAGPSTAAVLSSLRESSAEMVAYFETIPNAPIAAAASSGVTPPETVLSSALSLPIVSTVPIVSNQASLTKKEEEEEEEEEELGELSSEESVEEQLEEHRYHKNQEGSTAELAEVVLSLQKKVKVLQQRHRRHCAKLEAMEGVVEQLKKENLVSEEKLKLLEMACLQSSAIIPESGGAVAIICQDNDQALVYAVPQLQDEGNETIIHVKEQ
ncbi:THAP domain-containing protein 8 [Anolis carolinensis]|nr:PREDICTED: THAP domain-containing protein 5 [Anolis carolinensis]|eukprot:XP_008122628.1 PREDICTED: THAP domain-containing protein 5 [Anolis carolinensis]